MKIKSKTGKEYSLMAHHKSGWILKRLDSGKTEKISQSLVDKTLERLKSGESINFREISYTVAIETAVVAILKDQIQINHETKTYTLKESK